MVAFEKTLIDVEKRVYVENWRISSDDLKIGDSWHVEKRRLYGGVSDGVDIVAVDNGKLSSPLCRRETWGSGRGSVRAYFWVGIRL